MTKKNRDTLVWLRTLIVRIGISNLKINRNMIRNILVLVLVISSLSCNNTTGENPDTLENLHDTILVLKNPEVTLNISRFGGAITGFVFNDLPVNPFTWKMPDSEMPENNKNGAPFQGHFICTGRWGSPTSQEKSAGIPHNGEPSNIWWEKDSSISTTELSMSVFPRLEQFSVHRKISLSENESLFLVEEKISNLLNTGIFTAIVQHSTIGTPFLNGRTIISTNATFGFNQSLINKALTLFEYKWPSGYSDTLKNSIDLTGSDTNYSYVSTHIIEDEYGWVTAASPESGILVGYLWKSIDYPWLHVWNGTKEGKLWAKGLEFGTTGLGDTFSPEKRATITFHGVNNNLFIDAKSFITKKYICLLLKIPSDYIRTESIKYNESLITVKYLIANDIKKVNFNLKDW